jgi:putative transposase
VLNQITPKGVRVHHSTHENNSVLSEMIQLINENGESGMLEELQGLFNAFMKIERNHSLNADPYERNEDCLGYGKSYKVKTVNTRLGPMRVDILSSDGAR